MFVMMESAFCENPKRNFAGDILYCRVVLRPSDNLRSYAMTWHRYKCISVDWEHTMVELLLSSHVKQLLPAWDGV